MLRCFCSLLMKRQIKNISSIRSNWRWLLTFSWLSKQINHIFPKYKYGRQMDMRQTFKDTCAVQAQTSFITLNSRPLRTCRVKRRKSTCWPKRKPSCRCTLKMYVHIFQIEHIVHTICTTQMFFFQYLFCNFWNLQCVIAQCAFKLKCRTVPSNSSQTCSPGCNCRLKGALPWCKAG